MSHVDDGTLHAWLDGQLVELDPDEARRVREHLAECAACRERLDEERAVRERATALFESQDPLAGVELPTLAELRRQAGAGPPAAARVSRRARMPRWVPVGWAATVALALGVGYGIGVLGPDATSLPGTRSAGTSPERAEDGSVAEEPAESGVSARVDLESETLADAAAEVVGEAAAPSGTPADIPRDATAAAGAPAADRRLAAAELPAPDDSGAVAEPRAAAERAASAERPRTEAGAGSIAGQPAAPPPPAWRSDADASRTGAVAPRPVPAAVEEQEDALARQARLRESIAEVDAVPVAPTALETMRRRSADPTTLSAFDVVLAQDEASTPLVLPGLRVVEVVSEEVWPEQHGIRLVQAFPDGRQVELRIAGPPAAGAGPLRPPPPAAVGLPPGWSRSTRTFGGGWAELRGPLTADELGALLRRLAPGG